MNTLKARISHIESSENMSVVEFDVESDTFASIVIETPKTAAYLRIGNEVSIIFKETEVSLAKNLSGQISLRNRAKSIITAIRQGTLLTQVTLVYQGRKLVSIITSRSAHALDLKVGDEVEWLVKTTEVSIMESAS
jgi:molybdopterin-binding protein